MILLALLTACSLLPGQVEEVQPAEEPVVGLKDSAEGEAEDPIYDMDPDDLPQGEDPCRAPVVVEVTEVVDGDTFYGRGPAGSEKVRIIGVDTPEIGYGDDPPDCYGPEAQTYAREALEGRRVWLTFDGDCEDDYGRTLAYVITGEGDGGFFERGLLRGGYAETMTFYATSTYADTFYEDEDAAREAEAGLWGACD